MPSSDSGSSTSSGDITPVYCQPPPVLSDLTDVNGHSCFIARLQTIAELKNISTKFDEDDDKQCSPFLASRSLVFDPCSCKCEHSDECQPGLVTGSTSEPIDIPQPKSNNKGCCDCDPTTAIPIGLLPKVQHPKNPPVNSHLGQSYYNSKAFPPLSSFESYPGHLNEFGSVPNSLRTWSHTSSVPPAFLRGGIARKDGSTLPRVKLHYDYRMHKMYAGDRDAETFVVGSPPSGPPPLTDRFEMRNSLEAQLYYDQYYQPKNAPPKSVERVITPADIQEKGPMSQAEVKRATVLSDLLKSACTDHAVCIYINAMHQIKTVHETIRQEANSNRHKIQDVAQKLSVLEMAHASIDETIIDSEDQSRTPNIMTDKETLRGAVVSFLDNGKAMDKECVNLIGRLGEGQKLRVNTVNKMVTKDWSGRDISVSRARELLSRVVSAGCLEDELDRMAKQTLASIENLENCNMDQSQARVVQMIHSVLENYM